MLAVHGRHAQIAAVHDEGMIQQGGVAFLQPLQFVEEISEQAGLVDVNFRESIQLVRFEIVMRDLMVAHGDAEMRKGHRGCLARHHESPDPRQIRLERQRHQVEQ